VFRSIEARPSLPVGRDDSIPWEQSLCARAHAGESPATVPDTRRVPALWESWQRLRGQLGVDWDVMAFCTRDIRLPDGTFFGTLCIHHRETRRFSADEQGRRRARPAARPGGGERVAARLGEAPPSSTRQSDARRACGGAPAPAAHSPGDGYAEAMLDDVVP
jgi:hypothetical protein